MYPIIFNFCPPVTIYSYGTMIAMGVLALFYGTYHDNLRKRLISEELFFTYVQGIAVAVLVGTRLVHVISEWQEYKSISEIINIFQGGFSILGAILGALSYLIFKSYKNFTQISNFTDIITTYLPLAQFFGRAGCFLAGCCYGCATNVRWAVTYTDSNCLAPLHVALHPVQLYSAALMLILFFIMKKVRAFYQIPGQTTLFYLILSSSERFTLDFWRADRIISNNSILSFHQWIAAGIIFTATIFFIFISCRRQEITV